MKKILLSIKPEHVADILNHRKTLEFRTTAPKYRDWTVYEVHIYVTKGDGLYRDEEGRWFVYDQPTTFITQETLKTIRGQEPFNGKVVAKFLLRDIDEYECELNGWRNLYGPETFWQGIRLIERDEEDTNEYVAHTIASNEYGKSDDEVYVNAHGNLLEDSCLKFSEIAKYVAGRERAYGWHIDDLEVFETPRSLSDYRKANVGGVDYATFLKDATSTDNGKMAEQGRLLTEKAFSITKAPQSFMYVEEK